MDLRVPTDRSTGITPNVQSGAMASILKALELFGRASGAGTRVLWEGAKHYDDTLPQLLERAGRSAQQGWQEQTSFADLFNRAVPEDVRGAPVPMPFLSPGASATVGDAASAAGTAADFAMPGPAESHAAAGVFAYPLMRLLAGGRETRVLEEFAKMFGRSRELQNTGELTGTLPEEVSLFAQREARRAGVRAPKSHEDAAQAYADALLEDVRAALASGVVSPSQRDFYRESARRRPQQLAHIGRAIDPERYGRAGEILRDPRVVEAQTAFQVPHSIQSNPTSEALGGIESFIQMLADAERGSGRLAENVPQYKTGTVNRRLGGRGTGWSKAGAVVTDKMRDLARLADQLPGASIEDRLASLGDWLRTHHDPNEIWKARGNRAVEGGYAADWPSVVPQWRHVHGTDNLPGYAVLGAKTGSYAPALTGSDNRWAVFDTHARRGYGARTLSGFFGLPDMMSSAADEREAVAALKRYRSGDPSGITDALRTKRTGSGLLQFIEDPGGIASGERWIYQQGMQDAAERLGLGVDQTQSTDWHLKKYIDKLLGVNTPGGSGVSGLDEALRLAREHGSVFDPAERTPWLPGRDQARKMLDRGELTKAQASYLERELFSGRKPRAKAKAPRAVEPPPTKARPATRHAQRASGFVAYHGSPAKFDRFDLSKIGSGEGTSAYGRGIYLAENEDVAKFYRDMMAERNGNPPGYMYKVSVDASPDEILDYDAPLRLQPERVRAAIPTGPPPTTEDLLDSFLSTEFARAFPFESSVNFAKIAKKSRDPMDLEYWAEKWARPGEPPYIISGGLSPFTDETKGFRLIGRHGQDLFARAGVKGMRYLDEGSRAAGEGTRNFVSWRDDILNILKRYGIPIGALGGAAALSSPAEGGR